MSFDGAEPPKDAAFEAAHDAGDGGGGGDAGADTAVAWSPANLGAPLVLWLDGSRGVAVDAPSLVATWGDASGTGNHASATLAARPVRTPAALNGHDVITFNGTSTYLTVPDRTSLEWGTGDFAVLMVARYSNTPGGLTTNSSGLLWAKFDSNIPLPGVRFAGNSTSAGVIEGSVSRTAGNIVDSTKTYNDNVFHIFGLRRVSQTLEIRADKAVQGSVSAASIGSQDVSVPGTALTIGGVETTGYLIGDIAEVLAVKGALSAADLANVENYLGGRYAL